MKLAWNKLFKSPELSVIIPTYNRLDELKLCLEGFAQQTAPLDRFEVIVIDDGSSVDVRSVVEPFRKMLNLKLISTENSGPSVARNIGIASAAGPLLLLYDDDLRPFPSAVETCLDFHQRHPQPEHARLLYFRVDARLADCPALHWAFRMLYPFPNEEGVYDWSLFWSGTITCKKSLFEQVQFNPAFRSVEDSEFALRLSRRFDMRIHFDGRAQGVMTRRLRFQDVCRRQYLAGYFNFQLTRVHPGKLSFGAPYDEPERYIVANPIELKGLLTVARKMEAEAIRSESSASDRLMALWRRAEVHARASGWISARSGASLPGTNGAPLPAFE